jgi:hypothetical protein
MDGVNVVEIGTAGHESVNYYALFDSELRYYTVRFLNGTTVLQTLQVAYGETPVYTGAEPTHPDGNNFGGWSPVISPVTGNVDYTAKFIASTGTRALVSRTIEEFTSETVTIIKTNAFRECTKLTSVNLQNVASISNSAFDGCKSLISVRLPATPPTLASTMAFNNINSACVFYIPTGSISAYQADSKWSTIMSTYSFVEEDR